MQVAPALPDHLSALAERSYGKKPAHRSHANGCRFIRAWNRRNHECEMKLLKKVWRVEERDV